MSVATVESSDFFFVETNVSRNLSLPWCCRKIPTCCSINIEASKYFLRTHHVLSILQFHFPCEIVQFFPKTRRASKLCLSIGNKNALLLFPFIMFFFRICCWPVNVSEGTMKWQSTGNTSLFNSQFADLVCYFHLRLPSWSFQKNVGCIFEIQYVKIFTHFDIFRGWCLL